MSDMKEIGFYTLSNARCGQVSINSPLWRAEYILTSRCNFKCPYCRSIGGNDIDFNVATDVVAQWIKQGLKNVRFSGGEPTMYPYLPELITQAKEGGVERIAISTNGSATMALYMDLYNRGVNDFSISLDACCAEDGDKMAGGRRGAFKRVVNAITELSKLTYVTVGVVLTPDNKESAEDIIRFADSLGVADIRIIPAAQDGRELPTLSVSDEIRAKYPILRYRLKNLELGKPVRGLADNDPHHCGLVVDDMAVMGDEHYPCIIYMRESGKPIGKVGPDMRQERLKWYMEHDVHADPICKSQCLDVCVDHNRTIERLNSSKSDDLL